MIIILCLYSNNLYLAYNDIMDNKQLRIEIHESKNDNKVKDFFIEHWGGEFIVSNGETLYGNELPFFMATDENGETAGLLTYHLKNNECEIVTIDSLIKGQGAGTILIDKMIDKAKSEKYSKLWLMTTNDNISAMDFYKNRGFKLTEIHKGAIENSRELKKSIPEFGENGIRIEDEIIFEYPL